MLKAKTLDARQEVGPLCLEFVNTVRWHTSEHPEETLLSYVDLVNWAQRGQIVSGSAAHSLLQEAAEHPAEARQVLKRAVALREALYRIFVALIREASPADEDLAELNTVLTKMSRGGRLVRMATEFKWNWYTDEGKLDSMVGRVALSAAELLLSDERQRIGQCADDRGCGWLFLDLSKNRSRRWCDINDCGNRAKQRRHYARTRGTTRPA